MAAGPARDDKDARKANKRGAARLAAVQALYQMDLAGTGLNEILPNSKATGSAAKSRVRNICRPKRHSFAILFLAWSTNSESWTPD